MNLNLKNKAIVIGGDHPNTLGVVRSLGEEGVPVYLILVSAKIGYVSKSKYVTKTWRIENLEKELINILEGNFQNEEYKPIIIPTSDPVMESLDNNLEALKHKYILPNIDEIQGRVSQLMNKNIMNEIACKSGLTVPKSWEVELNNEDIDISKETVYPCIVKPLNSIDGKKSDIVICQNKLDLKKNLLNLKDNYDRVLIQEYIDGQDAKMIEIIGCVTLNNKEIIIPGIIEKQREYPLVAGSTSYALSTRKSRYINNDSIHIFINKLNYVGIFDLEFKYANGKTYFIEINFRNGAPGYVLTKMGVNIPYIWYLNACGSDTNNLLKEIDKDFNFMMETIDIRHVLNGDLNFFSWIKDLIDTKAFLFFNLKDMKPLISRIIGK